MHGIEHRQEFNDLRDEFILHQVGHFLFMASTGAFQQVCNPYLQRSGKPLQGRKSGDCFLILDFRYIGSRYRHAQRELALAESAFLPQRADRRCDVKVRPATTGRLGLGRLFHQDRLRLVLVERCLASSAKVIIGPELDQVAVIATNYFPGINRCQGCRHEIFRSGQSRRTPKSLLLIPYNVS